MLTVLPSNPVDSSSARRSTRSIKWVSCIVRPEKLDQVTAALNALNLVGGMTVTDVRGVGHEKGEQEIYRGTRFISAYVPRVKIDLVIEADDIASVENLIRTLAATGEVGDGKVFVTNVLDALRIRTGERGSSAL